MFLVAILETINWYHLILASVNVIDDRYEVSMSKWLNLVHVLKRKWFCKLLNIKCMVFSLELCMLNFIYVKVYIFTCHGKVGMIPQCCSCELH